MIPNFVEKAKYTRPQPLPAPTVVVLLCLTSFAHANVTPVPNVPIITFVMVVLFALLYRITFTPLSRR